MNLDLRRKIDQLTEHLRGDRKLAEILTPGYAIVLIVACVLGIVACLDVVVDELGARSLRWFIPLVVILAGYVALSFITRGGHEDE